jgi:hypothetical protein
MTMRSDRRRAGLAPLLIFITSAAALSTSPLQAAPPDGWIVAGDRRGDYDSGVDKSIIYGGKASAYLKSKVEETKGFGTLMQTVDAEKYRGKRVRLAAHIKGERLNEWAGLWMRVDGPADKVLAFDNMADRAITGTVDWKRYEVVLDVAPEAKAIAFGVLLSGKGTVFMNGVALDPVDKSVPTSGTLPPHKTEPANLDFDK